LPITISRLNRRLCLPKRGSFTPRDGYGFKPWRVADKSLKTPVKQGFFIGVLFAIRCTTNTSCSGFGYDETQQLVFISLFFD
jgi:hypothetical protein